MINTGKAVSKMLEDSEMSASDLARRVGVSRQQVHKWKSQDSMRTNTAERIAEAFGVSLTEFISSGQ